MTDCKKTKCKHFKKHLNVCASGISPKDIRKCEHMTTTQLKEVYKIYLKCKNIKEITYTKETNETNSEQQDISLQNASSS